MWAFMLFVDSLDRKLVFASLAWDSGVGSCALRPRGVRGPNSVSPSRVLWVNRPEGDPGLLSRHACPLYGGWWLCIGAPFVLLPPVARWLTVEPAVWCVEFDLSGCFFGFWCS